MVLKCFTFFKERDENITISNVFERIIQKENKK